MLTIPMRSLFIWMTGVFWIGIGYYAVRCPNAGAPSTQASGQVSGDLAKKGPRVARKPGLAVVSASELARHSTPGDCWIAIEGTVYDVTGYVDLHPSKNMEMEGYCGKEGTKAWDIKEAGKDRGQSHTRRAAEFLEEYPQVGIFEK